MTYRTLLRRKVRLPKIREYGAIRYLCERAEGPSFQLRYVGGYYSPTRRADILSHPVGLKSRKVARQR